MYTKKDKCKKRHNGQSGYLVRYNLVKKVPSVHVQQVT